MLTLKDITDKYYSFKIKERGYTYQRERRVKSIKLEGTKVVAQVKGTLEYHVSITFDENLYARKITCTCPYSKTDYCKHSAAALFELNQLGFFTTTYYRNQIWEAKGFSPEEILRRDEQIKAEQNKPAPEAVMPKRAQKGKKKILKPEAQKAHPAHQASEKQLIDNEPAREEMEEQRKAHHLELFKERMGQLAIKRQRRPPGRYTHKLAIEIKMENGRTLLRNMLIGRDETGNITDIRYPHSWEIEENTSASLEEFTVAQFVASFSVECSLRFPQEAALISRGDLSDSRRIARLLKLCSGKVLYSVSKIDKRLHLTPVSISGEEAAAAVNLEYSAEKSTMVLFFEHPQLGLISFEDAVPVLPEPLWFRYRDTLFKADNLTLNQYLAFSPSAGEISIAGDNHKYFTANILPSLNHALPLRSRTVQYKTIVEQSIPRVYLDEMEDTLRVTLMFAYGQETFSYSKIVGNITKENETTFVTYERDREFEDRIHSEMKEYGLKRISQGVFSPKIHPCDFLLEKLPLMVAKGFQIFGEESLKKFKAISAHPKLSIRVNSETDWFEVHADVRLNERVIPLRELLSLSSAGGYVRLDDGMTVKISPEALAQLAKHTGLAETDGNTIKFSRAQAGAVQALIEEAVEADVDETFAQFSEALKNFTSIQKHAAPAGLKAKLRPYQKHGFDWLYFLQEYRFGGILADDMGLGKTMQALALLLNEKLNGNTTASLVIAPTSVVFNWMKEAKQFAPALKLLNHTGAERIAETIKHFDEYDIILTSYGIMLRDFETLKHRQFHYIILDESQKVKNPVTKSSRCARLLKGSYRVCLSGTPVENNLLELWSQFTFINPGMLGTLHGFENRFIKPMQRENSGDLERYLRKLIYPFILRRTKEVVAKELPTKTEIVHYCDMTPEQEVFYGQVRDSIRAELMKKIDSDGIENSGMKILEGLLRLRQMCNHPMLVKKEYRGHSGKFEEFKEMVIRAKTEGHKALVFSQFTTMLAIMRDYLTARKIPYEYLAGDTLNRQERVEHFQNDAKVTIFLISLKAGGFGLNLTAADHVFLYDPWWNPAVERQAADRTHRIGQTKPVFIYKFITRGTVEEKILELQERKRHLVEKIITSEKGLFKSLTRKDIDGLFS